MADLISHEAPMHEAHALPVMLPSGKLIGRDVLLARVYSQLKENKPVLVYGAPGIGKTALAATLASAYTELPGGVLWLNMRNTPFPEVLARIGRAYNLREVATSENPLSAVSPAMNAVSAARPLIVFDGQINAQTVTEFIMRLPTPLPILLLSESELHGPWTNVPLGILEVEAAAVMVRQLAPEQSEGLNDLVTALNGIPFALTTAAGAIRAKNQTPAAFLASLPKRPDATPPLLALTASFSGLANPLQGLLLLFGATFRGEASAELFSLIANAPEGTVNQALSLLTQQHLVERFQRYGKPYYRLHTITQTFAQTWLRGSGRLEGLQNKVRDAILAYAHKYSGAPDRLAAEMDNMLAAAQWAADQGDREVANQLVVTLMQAGDFVKARGYVYELLLLRRLAASSTSAFPAYSEPAAAAPARAAAAPAAEDADEDEDESAAEATVDDVHAVRPIPAASADELDEDEDDYAEDEDEAAAEDDEDEDADVTAEDEDEDEDEESEPLGPPSIPDELERLRAQLVNERLGGNRRQQADLLAAIGREHIRRGQDNEAISVFSEAVNLYEALNNEAGLLASLEELAELTAKTDNSQAAVLHATRGIQLADQQGDESSQRKLLTILGDARQQLGESEAAIQAYAEALDLARTNADRASQALILYKLGFAQLDNSDALTAGRSWEDALTLFREQGRRDYEGRTLAALGTAAGEQEHWNEAINFYTSALYIARELKDREEEMLRLSDLGYAQVQAHQLGQAVLRYRQALHLAYQSGKRDNIVSTTVDLGRLLVESQRHLDVTELLVDAALDYDPNDRDLRRLKERIEDERPTVPETVTQVAVGGTAEDYAANAYALLENA